MKPIAMTGMGAVTPFGVGVERLWDALFRGESALSEMDLFDLQGLSCVRAGVCRFLPETAGKTPRALRLAEIACEDALRQTGPLPGSVALLTATNFGSVAETFSSAPESDADALSARFGLRGIRIPVSLSCASGASALALAAQLLTEGRVSRALVVGYDALTPFAWSGLCSLRTMTRGEIRPFDVNRDGTVFSEGAVALVVETAESAAARQAVPLAWVTGWATGNNGHHLTAPAPRGAGSRRVMERALVCAGRKGEEVGCIQAHGTGTKANDLTESEAIHDLFGAAASSLPVTSIKGALGHLLGASSSAELIAAALSLQRGAIPPTLNHRTPDPACELSIVTKGKEKAAGSFDTVLCNAAGFGGCNAAILLSSTPPLFPREEMSFPCPPIPVLGIGAVCALGIDTEEITAAWQEGEPPESFDVPEYELQECGVTPKPYLDPASKNLLAASASALAQVSPAPAGVMIGTARGCVETTERFFADYRAKGPRFVRPFLFPHTYANTPASLVAMEWSLDGPHLNVAGGNGASGVALIAAVDALRRKTARRILAGGTDARAGGGENAGEAAAALLLGKNEDGAFPVGWILGCGFAEDEESAIARAYLEAGISANPVSIGHAQEANEKLFRLCGKTGGATTALLAVLALSSSSDEPTLVLTHTEQGTSAVLLSSARFT